MIHLLIDNSSLRGLVDIHGYSNFLTRLEAYVNTNEIKLYTHITIIEEWNKHKTSWAKQKQQKLLGNSTSAGDVNPIAAIQNSNVIFHINEQFHTIDSLLTEAFLLSTHK